MNKILRLYQLPCRLTWRCEHPRVTVSCWRALTRLWRPGFPLANGHWRDVTSRGTKEPRPGLTHIDDPTPSRMGSKRGVAEQSEVTRTDNACWCSDTVMITALRKVARVRQRVRMMNFQWTLASGFSCYESARRRTGFYACKESEYLLTPSRQYCTDFTLHSLALYWA